MLKNLKKIENLEEELVFQAESNEVPPTDVFAYNELRSCADLFRMFKDGALEIQPKYQREIVWNNADQTRFIDSLMKQLPIPSMCFSLDSKTQKWQVIDGLQRMATIIRFLDDQEKWELSELDDIDPRIKGKAIEEIKKKNHDLYRKVENITLPITILRCDLSKRDHTEYIFTIFRRLNTGGLKLNNQEIRNAIFQGPFNDFLNECNKNKSWIKIVGSSKQKGDRFRKVELVLRFFAFFDDYENYQGRLADFLNEYMRRKRYLNDEEIQRKRKFFEKTAEFIASRFYTSKSTHKISNVVVDALLFGVSKNFDSLLNKDDNHLKRIFAAFLASRVFSDERIREGIFKKEKVLERLDSSLKIFASK